jgi:D-glycero-D-manno-heptose 1,7-bisphosphate phosphatase
MMQRRAVFLDRDGVLNDIVIRAGQPASPRSAGEFSLRPEAAVAVSRLRRCSDAVFVVTNQPDIARGLLPRAELDAMLERLRVEAGVDDIAVCEHQDGDGCLCRKPLPGLLHGLAERWEVDLTRSFIVGDTWRDMDAGRAAGCTTVLLRTWYNTEAEADMIVNTLSEAVSWIEGQRP